MHSCEHQTWCLKYLLPKKTILLTRPENAEHVAKTHLTPAYTIEEAMKLALENCGTPNPKITVMPQGASVLSRLKK